MGKLSIYNNTAMSETIQENTKYFLKDDLHYFIVRKDEYDKSITRVCFYKGDIYVANERLMNRTLESLRAEFENRKSLT